MDALHKFLALIAYSEGTSSSTITQDDGYDVIVSGVHGPERFDDYSEHPFASREPKLVRPGLYSTAAGRYQILLRYWKVYKQRLSLPDFGHDSQDAVAVQMLRERRALPLIEAGQIEQAVVACSAIWASFPGNDYQQNAHSMKALLEFWNTL
jgi:muramidase (phage lysozyme)